MFYVADIFTNQIHVCQSKFNNITFHIFNDTVEPGPAVRGGLLGKANSSRMSPPPGSSTHLGERIKAQNRRHHIDLRLDADRRTPVQTR